MSKPTHEKIHAWIESAESRLVRQAALIDEAANTGRNLTPFYSILESGKRAIALSLELLETSLRLDALVRKHSATRAGAQVDPDALES